MNIRILTIKLFLLLAILIAVPAQAEDNRFEVGLGLAYGGGSGRGTGGSSNDIDNFGTGLGLAAGVQYWKDSVWGTEHLSVGAEYEFNHFYTKLNNGSSTTRGSLDLHSLLINFAARKSVEDFSPYVGAGLGASYYEASTNRRVTNRDKSSVSGIAPMLQIFAGVDYDLSEKYYTGFQTKFSYVNAEPAGMSVSYHKLDTMLKLGVKF